MIFDADSWQEIWGTIRRNRLRTLLTVLGVFWGVFMLIVMVGAGNGLERGVKKSMSGFAANSMAVWGDRTSIPHKGLGPGRPVEFDNADTDALRAVPGVEHVAPRIQLGGWRLGNNVTRGAKAAAFQVNGDTPAIRQVQMVNLVAGRHLNDLDLAETRKIAVVGKRVKELLFEEGDDVLGQAILIRGTYFEIVGLFESPSSGDEGERINTTIYIPFTTFQKAFNQGDRVGWFALTIDPRHRSADVEEAVKRVLRSRHDVAPDDPQALDSFNAEKEFKKVENLFLGIRILIWIVGTATLLAGVVGVSNIMLISVKERTKEIGVRKALGATPARIIGQILQESVVLTALAGYVGVVAGVGVLEAARAAIDAATRAGSAPTMFADPQVDVSVAIVAAAVLIVSGAFAGLIPARNAARVNPVIALRSE
jgi:putative ABC transport system permease protein